MFGILQYLPCPWGVVALRGIPNQGFDFFEVATQGCNLFIVLDLLATCWQFRLTIFIYHYAVEFVLFLNAFNWYSIGVIVDVIAHI